MYDKNIVDIIEIDADNQLVVVQDTLSESPLDWGWDVEYITIDDYRIWRGWETPEDPVAYAAHCAQYKYRDKVWTEEQRDRAVHIFKLLVGDDRDFAIHEWRGYSKSDWATFLEIGEDTGLFETYAQWLRGDVYGVIHRKRVVWTTEDRDDTLETWEEENALWGCYLDEDYTAIEVAKEYFDVEVREG